MRELQLFAGVVHGFLAFGHLLGVIYNSRRGNKLDAAVHSVALCYDVKCAYKHYKAVEREDEEPEMLFV